MISTWIVPTVFESPWLVHKVLICTSEVAESLVVVSTGEMDISTTMSNHFWRLFSTEEMDVPTINGITFLLLVQKELYTNIEDIESNG